MNDNIKLEMNIFPDGKLEQIILFYHDVKLSYVS